MGDVEGAVGVGQRAPVGDPQARARRRRDCRAGRGAPPRGPRLGCRSPRPRSDRPRRRRRRAARPGCRRRRSRRRAAAARPCPAKASIAAAVRPPAEQPVDPSEVAQVAGQRRRIVERPVEELLGAGQAFHREQATSRRRLDRWHADPGRDAPSDPPLPAIRLPPSPAAARGAGAVVAPAGRHAARLLPDPERRRPWHRRARDPEPRCAPPARPDRARRPSSTRDHGRRQGVPVRARPRPDGRRRPADVGTLVVPLGPGISGAAVMAAPDASSTTSAGPRGSDGVYGSVTAAEVAAFQAHIGPAADGSVDPPPGATCLALRATRPRHGRPVRLHRRQRAATGGPPSAIAPVTPRPRRSVTRLRPGRGRRRQLEHGGDIPGTRPTRSGLDVDIRPMRKANDQCRAARTGASRTTTGPRRGR